MKYKLLVDNKSELYIDSCHLDKITNQGFLEFDLTEENFVWASTLGRRQKLDLKIFVINSSEQELPIYDNVVVIEHIHFICSDNNVLITIEFSSNEPVLINS